MKTGTKRLIMDAGMLAAIGLLAAVLILLFIEREWRIVSERYIHDATRRAAAEFQQLAEGVQGSLAMVQAWGRSGVLDPTDEEPAKALLAPFYTKHDKLSGIAVAGTEDQGFFMLRDGTSFRPLDEGRYDPKKRPWFGPALESEDISWTGIYRFSTLDQMGITASVSWPGKKQRFVVAFDVLLEDFFIKVQQMAPTPASRAFIFLPDGQLYVPDGQAEDVKLRSIELFNADGAEALEAIKMHHEGREWWCGFLPLEKSRRAVWMGVLVPESDILGDIATKRWIIIGIGLVAFAAMTALYILLMRRHRNPMRMMPVVSDEEVMNWIKGGENRSVEFKSTIRMNLHSKKPGKEIELAWLKGVAGFLNTDGGILLLGVNDAGEVIGLEQDVFENEDKCRLHFKNLIANHLGADLSRYIRFILVSLQEKTVGVVMCARSEQPVFLKDGNKEHFYIRNGPSSDELPVSQALNYIRSRKS
jgi:hypothetical protein